MIQTKNLQLFPYERVHVEALLRDRRELAALLNVAVPDSWPNSPEAFTLSDDDSPYSSPEQAKWRGYFFIHPNEKVLVGNGGFKGEPDKAGAVEIGYEIAFEYWNRGFASEAAQGLMDYAFTDYSVRAVIAYTLAHKNASNAVLQKVGMKFLTEIDDAEHGKIWCWQITRDQYRPS